MYVPADYGKGFVKIEYRRSWNDGLESHSGIRLINPKTGIIVAPRSWEHLVDSLKLNDVPLANLEAAVDRRIDNTIIYYHRSLTSMKDIFGETHVDEVITRRGKSSFIEEIKELAESILKRRRGKGKPKLTVVDGGQDET
jgi:hypothetical protein